MNIGLIKRPDLVYESVDALFNGSTAKRWVRHNLDEMDIGIVQNGVTNPLLVSKVILDGSGCQVGSISNALTTGGSEAALLNYSNSRPDQ